MNNTGIKWTNLTWNPVSGCDRVGPECKYCYAEALAERFRGTPGFPQGFDLTLRPKKLTEPVGIDKPSLIFVNSTSDVFHEGIPDEYRDRIFDVIEKCSRHEFQVLTKRYRELLRYSRRRKIPRNAWMGVSVGHVSSLPAVDVLREVDAEIRFLSVEPMLSDLTLNLDGIHQVIGGGESGLHLQDPDIRANRAMADLEGGKWVPRKDRYEWARHLRDQTKEAGVSFFWKQWGGVKPESAGRELDGRTWDEFPRLPKNWRGWGDAKRVLPVVNS